MAALTLLPPSVTLEVAAAANLNFGTMVRIRC